MNHDGDPLLDPLARRMRDQGSQPSRDLWPDIEAAIDRREQTRRRSLRAGGWRLAAVAAALAVALLGARGLLVPGTDHAPVASALNAATAADANDEESVLTRALADLNDALRTDPENIELSRLVLMVHQFRGDMLRRSGRSALQAR